MTRSEGVASAAPRLRTIDWLAPGLLLGITVAMVAWLVLRPAAGQPVLAWFSPRLPADDALSAAVGAGALIIDRGRLPVSFVVQPGATDGIARLRDAGAWLIVNAQFFGGCGGRRQ